MVVVRFQFLFPALPPDAPPCFEGLRLLSSATEHAAASATARAAGHALGATVDFNRRLRAAHFLKNGTIFLRQTTITTTKPMSGSHVMATAVACTIAR
jgi:hypothetical protein